MARAPSGEPEGILRAEDLRQVSQLGLVARWIVEGTITGLHRSPFHGFSIEFAEYREYAQGDDLRYLDWKAYGKSDRSYIKKFHSETNLACHLLVDASASMGYGDPSKLRYAQCLAAALAYVLSGQQEMVGLAVLDEGIRLRLPPASGQAHLGRIFECLEAAEPSSRTSLGPALNDLAEAVRRRGLFVLLSDLHDDEGAVLEGIRHLRFRGHEVIVFHILDPAELRLELDRLVDFEDLETGDRIEVHGPSVRDEYRRRVAEWTAVLRAGCDGCRAEHLLVETSKPFAAALAAYLHRRSQRRAAP